VTLYPAQVHAQEHVRPVAALRPPGATVYREDRRRRIVGTAELAQKLQPPYLFLYLLSVRTQLRQGGIVGLVLRQFVQLTQLTALPA
jgi:hypothetical protein